jgi:hypothetical protein
MEKGLGEEQGAGDVVAALPLTIILSPLAGRGNWN